MKGNKKKKRRVVFATCLRDDKKITHKETWDKIIKEKLEEKYGKIK